MSAFLGRVVLVVGVVALALLLWQTAGILLLVFAGMLVALFLRTLVLLVQQVLPLGDGGAFSVVAALLLVVTLLLGWFLAPELSGEVEALRTGIPVAVQNLEDRLEGLGWGEDVFGNLPSLDQLDLFGSDLLSRVTGAFSTTIGGLANLGFILFIGLFVAVSPNMYREGSLQLIPKARRERAREVLAELATTLRWWLVGQFIAMLIIGVLTTLGLWLLGMPFALGVGVISGLLEFIPFVGPFVGGALAVLLAFVEGPLQALYVLILYVLIQQIEGNVLMPLVHQYTVALAPALTLTAVLVVGLLFGFVGVLVATPLVAVGVVLVKMLYIEDVLDGEADLPKKMFKAKG